MPPPVFHLGKAVVTKIAVDARLCLARGYKRIDLPPGRYIVLQISRDEQYWHDYEHSDGYTYRLTAKDPNNPFYGHRISVWQSDLASGVYGGGEEGWY